MPASLDLIGRGWAFPLGVDARGGIALAEGDEEIRQAILLILRTRRGARVMRPEFGCRIWELLFAPNDSSTWTLAGHHVREALGWWEPRIEVEDVRATVDPGNQGAMDVEVDYTIRATHDRRSLVFPFYLIPDEPAAAAAKVAETKAAMAEPGSVPAPVVAGAHPPVAVARTGAPSSRSAPTVVRPEEASR
ncbi:MAG TPA: GPW/gp25 family protein [Candidatus Limnocylindrales bacterium]